MPYSAYKFVTSDDKGALAWVNFQGNGAVAIRDEFNVSSITDLGTGKYRINFKTSMKNVKYAPMGIASLHYGSDGTSIVSKMSSVTITRIEEGYVEIMTASREGNEYDPTTVTLVIFGD